MLIANPEDENDENRSEPRKQRASRLASVVMCLSVEAGGGFEVREVPRRSPAADEIEIAVEAASVNPIDVRRADGYGRRLLSLLRASQSATAASCVILPRS